MNPLILDLIVLAVEKGPGLVREVRASFADGEEPSIEEIIKRLNAMAPPFEADPLPIEPDED